MALVFHYKWILSNRFSAQSCLMVLWLQPLKLHVCYFFNRMMCRPSSITSSWVSSRQNRPRRSPEVSMFYGAPNSPVQSSLQSWTGHLLLPRNPPTHLWLNAGKTDWDEDAPAILPLLSVTSLLIWLHWTLQSVARKTVFKLSLWTKLHVLNVQYNTRQIGNVRFVYRLFCFFLWTGTLSKKNIVYYVYFLLISWIN